MLLTDDAAVAEAGGMAGCYQVPAPYGAGWQAAGDIAAHICRLLQVQPLHAPGAADAAPALAAVLAAAGAATGGSGEGEEESDDVVDMVLLVLHAPNAPGSSGGDDGGGSAGDGVAALEWADSLVRALNQAPGFRDTVLLSFVLGPGQQPLSAAPLLRQEQALLQPGAPAGAGPAAADCPAVRRPLQSFQCAGQERVAVDPHRPALVVQRLRAVIRRVCGAGTAPHLVPGARRARLRVRLPSCHLTPALLHSSTQPYMPHACRVDRARHLGLPHIVQHGGAGGILAERLLPEVACKLGRAPKYGA